jgi:hypothetical protein
MPAITESLVILDARGQPVHLPRAHGAASLAAWTRTAHHDRYFRERFGRLEIAQDFLCHNLPAELLAEIDLATLEISRDTMRGRGFERRLLGSRVTGRLSRG